MNVASVYTLSKHLPGQFIELGTHLKVGVDEQREMITNKDCN